MTPARRFTAFPLTAICLFAIAVAATSLAAADRPNVLIIYSDDQGTLDAGCYGSEDIHTPAINSLAERGVRFTQAYAHTVCCPSRAALMTGRHPQRTGVKSWAQRAITDPEGVNMSLDDVTLAEVYQQAGWGRLPLEVVRLFGRSIVGWAGFGQSPGFAGERSVLLWCGR